MDVLEFDFQRGVETSSTDVLSSSDEIVGDAEYRDMFWKNHEYFNLCVGEEGAQMDAACCRVQIEGYKFA